MLYKYLPPERLDVLSHRRIRFTSPVSLNDPFEYRLKIGEHEYAIQPDVAKSETKFISLSRNHTNLLMWSHYANSHKGIVVGFSRSHPYFQNAKPVRYRRLRSVLNGVNLATFEPAEITKVILIEKALDWAYEEEERLFIDDVDNNSIIAGLDEWEQEISLNKFPESAIKSVYLGLRVSSDIKKKVIGILNTYQEKISLYRAKVSKDEYGIKFTEVEYT